MSDLRQQRFKARNMKEIKFNVHKPEDIPPMTDQVLQVSEFYFARTKTVGNEIKNCLAAYDFKKQKWVFGMSGHVELIEYYKEKTCHL